MRSESNLWKGKRGNWIKKDENPCFRWSQIKTGAFEYFNLSIVYAIHIVNIQFNNLVCDFFINILNSHNFIYYYCTRLGQPLETGQEILPIIILENNSIICDPNRLFTWLYYCMFCIFVGRFEKGYTMGPFNYWITYHTWRLFNCARSNWCYWRWPATIQPSWHVPKFLPIV